MKKLLLTMFLLTSLFCTKANTKETNLFPKINPDEKVFNIKDFGAKPTYSSDFKNEYISTKAVQAAIDACSKNGHGVVLVPKGHFTVGTLFLKSNIHIHLEEGAELDGSSDFNDYAKVRTSTEEPQFSECMFFADNVQNIKFTGQSRHSMIDGRGYFFKRSKRRPRLFRIENCKNIEFNGIILRNSASWCLVFQGCDNIYMKDVSLFNLENRNNDGIDLDGCSNVKIENCNIETSDDAICLKSSVEKTCENIIVTNCVVSSRCAAVKFGTASGYGFKNVKVKDCKFYNCTLGAIKLMVVDGGYMDGVEISNIDIARSAGPIFIRLGNRGRSYKTSVKQVYSADAKPEGMPVGYMRNIKISNVKADIYSLKTSLQGILITGIPGYKIQNLTLENMELNYIGHGDLSSYTEEIKEDEARYPEQNFFGVLPSYGMFIRHVDGIKLKNIRMNLNSYDSRSALFLDDVDNAIFENVTLDKAKGVKDAIKTKGEVNYKKKSLKIISKKF